MRFVAWPVLGILIALLAPDASAQAHRTGVVHWFNDSKGYGFITPDDKSADVFVHSSVIQEPGVKALKEGEKVTYDLRSTPLGLAAANVQYVGALHKPMVDSGGAGGSKATAGPGGKPPPPTPAANHTGVVAWYDARRTQGAVTPDKPPMVELSFNDGDLLMDPPKAVSPGAKVTYDAVPKGNGYEAKNIHIEGVPLPGTTNRRGVVVWIGPFYGSIRPDDKSKDIPFSLSGTQTPPVGTSVLYDAGTDAKYHSTPWAANIRVVK
jgi:CspA family cold shock protein